MLSFTCVVCEDLPPLKDYERSQVSALLSTPRFILCQDWRCVWSEVCKGLTHHKWYIMYTPKIRTAVVAWPQCKAMCSTVYPTHKHQKLMSTVKLLQARWYCVLYPVATYLSSINSTLRLVHHCKLWSLTVWLYSNCHSTLALWYRPSS